ncbi:uncharacterized protein LOC128737814 [Sabethes cyaneus]|uniref:uncharacterized protein LOC128737814 n=1 Tax=Sabethes cyaneus TaxID=53552 RepID=UPI00237EB829|nr:uncharacterized protein LOC128737814 [Sabethes cyaneus]
MKFTVAAAPLLLLVIGLTLCSGAVHSDDEMRKFTKTCGKVLQTSPETFQKLKDKDYGEDKDLYCLVRCIGIMTRFYDDETGPNWELVEQHLDGKPGFAEYREAMQQCIAALDPTAYGEDYCKKSFLYFQCSMQAYKEHIQGKKTAE